MTITPIFDPSDSRVLGRVAALALVAQDRIPLGEVRPVYGSGVYALYYSGPSALYEEISDKETPIYVGKSTPPDGALTVVEQGTALYERLQGHRNSIQAVERYPNDTVGRLSLSDFECRFIAVGTGWEAPAELELIRYFRPVWNKGNGVEPVQGFGGNAQGGGRKDGGISEWDTLHPGRTRQSTKPNEKTEAELIAQIHRHFINGEVAMRIFDTVEDVVDHFLSTLTEPPTNV